MRMIRWTMLVLAACLTACDGNERDYDAAGVFEATEIIVSAEQTGRLIRFDLREGSKVETGEHVGLIDTVYLYLRARELGATRDAYANQRPDLQKQLAVTRQQLKKAETEQHRYEALVNDEAATRKQLDDVKNTVQVLRRQLEAQTSSLRNSMRSLNSRMNATDIQRVQVLDLLDKCHIKTPIAGTVLEKYTEQGEFTTVGKPLFKVADTKRMFIRAYITSAQLEKVKIGQRVEVTSNYGAGRKKTYEGTVVWISDRSEFTPKTILTDDERADLVYAVKIAVRNDGFLKIGLSGEVKL